MELERRVRKGVQGRVMRGLHILIMNGRVCVRHLLIILRWGWWRWWCCGALLDARGTGEEPRAPVIERESDRERHDIKGSVARHTPRPNTSSIACLGCLDELVVVEGRQGEMAGSLELYVSSELDT